MSKSYSNIKNENKSNKKNVRYYRVCGICGERHLQNQMIKDRKSHTGWVCEDCFEDGVDYFDENIY